MPGRLYRWYCHRLPGTEISMFRFFVSAFCLLFVQGEMQPNRIVYRTPLAVYVNPPATALVNIPVTRLMCFCTIPCAVGSSGKTVSPSDIQARMQQDEIKEGPTVKHYCHAAPSRRFVKTAARLPAKGKSRTTSQRGFNESRACLCWASEPDQPLNTL